MPTTNKHMILHKFCQTSTASDL